MTAIAAAVPPPPTPAAANARHRPGKGGRFGVRLCAVPGGGQAAPAAVKKAHRKERKTLQKRTHFVKVFPTKSLFL